MEIKKILFLCTGNSCRSQMAEGWAKHLVADRFEASSAGVESHRLNPRAVQVMAEAGVDISLHTSRLIGDFNLNEFACIITVCDHAYETCPLVPEGCRSIHQGFDDPPKLAVKLNSEEEKLNCYRKVRDEIKEYIETLPALLAEEGGHYE